MYRHYSFDLWMTLIKSNPAFKKARTEFFYKNLNAAKRTLDETATIFRQVDIMCNSINEKTGKNIDADEMYLMVISIMNNFEPAFNNINMQWLYDEMEKLLFSYLPVIYSDDTKNCLDKLKQKEGISFNISSNTAFIKGKTMRKVLSHLEIAHFFDFQIYSDEIGISKPDKLFFQSMLGNVMDINVNSGIKLKEIVHVGDSIQADIAGASSVGIDSIQINSNERTILSLLN